MGTSGRSGAKEGKNGHQREPNGNRELALAYIQAQCGSLFRRGFSLTAHRSRLYIRTAGTKVPLELDLSSPWQEVQRRAAGLQELLRQGPYCAEVWQLQLHEGRPSRRNLSREELDAFWHRRKMAEGISEHSYGNLYRRLIGKLDKGQPLSTASLMAAITGTPPGTLMRRRAVRVYRSLVEGTGHSWPAAILDPLEMRQHALVRRPMPLFSDEEIEEIVLGFQARRSPYWRIFALCAIYGLRPWEAWVAEHSTAHADCVWVPIGKKNPNGLTRPREVPPFHRRWLKLFAMEEAWELPLPKLCRKAKSAAYSSKQLHRYCGVTGHSGRSPYGFRNAYARRIHSAEYRVTDDDAALFMGHTVAIHNQVYRRWVATSDDPIARYLDGAAVLGATSRGRAAGQEN